MKKQWNGIFIIDSIFAISVLILPFSLFSHRYGASESNFFIFLIITLFYLFGMYVRLVDYNNETWIEREGGPEGTVSVALPATAPAINAFPGATLSVSVKKDDDDLGTSIVQFSDPLTRRYDIGKMNFKRK